MSRFARVLVATDGSASCRAASEAAIELAGALGAELVALSVTCGPDAGDADLTSSADPLGAAEAATMALTRADEAAAEAMAGARAREVASNANARGVAARAITWEGSAGEAIVAAAIAERVDLIVVGTHCRGRLGRLVAGSVSDDVVHHAPVPVLVVRTPPAGATTA
jgi:nucleotide-binding universal stress UspA family protein